MKAGANRRTIGAVETSGMSSICGYEPGGSKLSAISGQLSSLAGGKTI
jgi:hypothetical protein